MKFSYCGASAVVLAYMCPSALAFIVPTRPDVGVRNTIAPHRVAVMRASCHNQGEEPASRQLAEALPKSFTRLLAGATAAAASSLAGVSGAIAAYVDPDDVGEVVTSDLPPVWVPLALGAVLTVGISLLQGSLGDVMNDEAKLGSLSGARAAKQSARDRNMFKKK